MADKKKLRKSFDKKISGVCAGIAEYFDVDPTFIRIAWVILTIGTTAFPGIIAYIVCALIFPSPTENINTENMKSANDKNYTADTTHIKED
ncbi:MAG: PspC domain-containing protein [Treponema sp.]|nr:PspC domain-containing protein [Treponema sp.]